VRGEHVLVLKTVGAPERRLLARRKPREAEPEPEPSPVPTARVTVIDASGLGGEEAAQSWLAAQRDEPDPGPALAVLNHVLASHRVAAADPHVREIRLEQALVARLGYGSGEEVAEGRWTAAVELPLEPRARRRSAALRPQERLAALLGGRDQALVCETLALRARADLDGGRLREAALTLDAAMAAALAELMPGDAHDMESRLVELRRLRGAAAVLAQEALQGPLPPSEAETLGSALDRLQAALRARSAAGLPER
jgi:hypothetical protein